MSRTITQAEARRLLRENRHLTRVLESQRNEWSREWPDGRVVARAGLPTDAVVAIRTARALDHAVVVQLEGSDALFFALRLPGATS